MRGGADDSFGIEVAKLAGVPDRVLTRAKQVLKQLEGGQQVSAPRHARRTEPEEEFQLALTPSNKTEILEKLKNLDVNTLTPIECMNTLFELCKLAR